MVNMFRWIAWVIAGAITASLLALTGANTASAAPELPTQAVMATASIYMPAPAAMPDQVSTLSSDVLAPAAAADLSPAFINALTPAAFNQITVPQALRPEAYSGTLHCGTYSTAWTRVGYMYRPNYYLELWAKRTSSGRYYCVSSTEMGRANPTLYIKLRSTTYSGTIFIDELTFVSTGVRATGASWDNKGDPVQGFYMVG